MANPENVSQPEWTITLESTYTQQENMKSNEKKSQRKSQEMMMWNKIFALVCVVAVSLDPLFIYVPIINQKDKCLHMDNALRIIAVVLRLFTDLIYIGDIVFNVAEASKALKVKGSWKSGKFLSNAYEIWKDSWLVLLVDFLAILPIPQTVLLSLISKVKGSRSLDKRKFLNFLLLSQYVPRVFRIYLSSKELTRTRDTLITGTVWIRGAFNFFLYVLASHVFGAFWYFFSVQRETACWHRACSENSSISGCSDSTLSCDEKTERNVELLSNSCPTKPKNTNEMSAFFDFDFGIFQDALESGVLSTEDFPKKLAHCFWWGLRNLSSLGQNLKTSTFFWENLFAVSISIVGLLLFLYLIGNLQTYMQLATTRSEEVRRKMKLKDLEIEVWISKNGLSKEMKEIIMDKVKDRLEENKDVDVQNLLHILPPECRKTIKRLLCFTTLKKVEIFKDMDEQVLNVICDHLKPVLYPENTHIIREGDPLDQMLFITQGTIWVYAASIQGGRSTSTNMTTKRLKKGDYFGEELVKWLLTHNSLTDFPISTANVKSHTKVEAFALRANDLMNAISRFWWLFRRNLSGLNSKSPAEKWELLAISAVKSIRQRRIAQGKKSMESLRVEDRVEDGGGKLQSMKYGRLK